jgi:phosphatidylinositol kinase/protein kinase (PI-3  family)
MKKFNLKKLKEVQGREQYRAEISNSFAALENSDAEMDINRAWKTIRENIDISAKESINHSVTKDAQNFRSKKQAKSQSLQDPSEIIAKNLNNKKGEASRYFRNKRGNVLGTKLMSLQRTVRRRTLDTV